MATIGINGFGRIGRCFTRLALEKPELNIAVVNDLASIQELAHLLKYDSSQGTLPLAFKIAENQLVFSNGTKIVFTQHANPKEIPWAAYGVDDVIESSGKFLSKDSAGLHLAAGAKRVLISAPSEADVPAIVLGVSEQNFRDLGPVISNASCTTNNAAPMIKVIESLAEIQMGHLSTIHSYTSDQRLQDAPHKDLRRARAATNSIIPTSTGAATALVKIFPHLTGRLSGSSVRVPVLNGSMTELTLITERELSVQEINDAMKRASEGEMKGILGITHDPIVSCDVIGSTYSCLFDPQLTVVSGKLIRLAGWYDNEMGYSARLVDFFINH
ncbi:MAG: type I glyceraldehyde-3-phosphate dehydrogenase [Bacteroidetes bacterium]|nr:type I glyceraldehyde-3-phosphate dehydrogenase [Bacteroidota bacterium]